MAVDRQYRDRHGRVASVHLAVFEKIDRRNMAFPIRRKCATRQPAGRLGEAKYVSPDQGGATENVAEVPAHRTTRRDRLPPLLVSFRRLDLL